MSGRFAMQVATKALYRRVRPQDVIKRWRLVKGDKVQILWGKDKGKQGEIKDVRRKQNRVIVSGLNLVKKHIKSTETQKGGIFESEAYLHVSKLALLDPSDQKPTKVSYRYVERGGKIRKIRVSRRTGLEIPKPIHKKREHEDGPKDTQPELVLGKFTILTKAADAVKAHLQSTLFVPFRPLKPKESKAKNLNK